jgi:hypothetical protein
MKEKKKKSVKKLVPLARLALKNEFYYEAVIIISSVMEAKLKTIITRVDKSNPGIAFTLEPCIKRVKYLATNVKDPLLLEHFDIAYLDELRNWKNHRNIIFKSLPETPVSRYRIEKLAKDGFNLLNRLIVSFKKFKRDWEKSLVKEPA